MPTLKSVIHFSICCVSQTSAALIRFREVLGRGKFSFQKGLNIQPDVKLANAAEHNQLHTADSLVRKPQYAIYQLLNVEHNYQLRVSLAECNADS